MDLEKLKKLEAKASPAPWWQDAVDCEDGHGHYKAYCVGYEHKSILDTANSDVQLIEQDDGPRYDITGHYDTEFIAEMRNATPSTDCPRRGAGGGARSSYRASGKLCRVECGR